MESCMSCVPAGINETLPVADSKINSELQTGNHHDFLI